VTLLTVADYAAAKGQHTKVEVISMEDISQRPLGGIKGIRDTRGTRYKYVLQIPDCVTGSQAGIIVPWAKFLVSSFH
jgi:hypothetical protein